MSISGIILPSCADYAAYTISLIREIEDFRHNGDNFSNEGFIPARGAIPIDEKPVVLFPFSPQHFNSSSYQL